MYMRFARGLPAFFRRRLTLDQANAIVAARLESRGETFLRIVDRAVFQREQSPYLFLFREARCDLEDIRRMVRADGLDSALVALLNAGVGVSAQEFRARVPIVRNGRELSTTASAFDNPFSVRHYESETSGSTGMGMRVGIDLDHIADAAVSYVIAYDAHGVLNAPMLLWANPLPDGVSINNLLRSSLTGNVVRRWFVPHERGGFRPAPRFRIATSAIVRAARATGVAFPRPESVGYDRAEVVANAAKDEVRANGACLLRLSVSAALRVGLAARDRGIDLTGVVMMGGSEPTTETKAAGITSSGAKWVPTYALTEIGPAGVGCASPSGVTDVHVCEDSVAVTRREGGHICLTALLPSAPKLMINVSSDDHATVERRECGCGIGARGLTMHLRGIGSGQKLTGEGVTLAGTDIVRVVEELLPSRLGGSALDYQLVEEEDRDGFTRMTLLVSPDVTHADDSVVISAVLDGLSNSSDAGRTASDILRAAGALRVRREKPSPTDRGKQPAFRTLSK